MNNRAVILSFMDLFSFIRLGRRSRLGQAQPTHKSATLAGTECTKRSEYERVSGIYPLG